MAVHAEVELSKFSNLDLLKKILLYFWILYRNKTKGTSLFKPDKKKSKKNQKNNFNVS